MQLLGSVGRYVPFGIWRLALEPIAPEGRLGAAILPFPGKSRAEGLRPRHRTRLLFVCRTHAVLSPIAERLARTPFARLDISVHSAGLTPQPLDPRAITVMSEIGFGMEDFSSTPVRELDLASFQYVISIGVHRLGLCRDQVAVTWKSPEFDVVADQVSLRGLRAVRDALSARVQTLGAILAAEHRA